LALGFSGEHPIKSHLAPENRGEVSINFDSGSGQRREVSIGSYFAFGNFATGKTGAFLVKNGQK
jgi:hypothetical protein